MKLVSVDVTIPEIVEARKSLELAMSMICYKYSLKARGMKSRLLKKKKKKKASAQ